MDPATNRPWWPHRAVRLINAIVITMALLVGFGLPACRAKVEESDVIRALLKQEVAAINARDLKALSEVWSREDTSLLFDVPEPGRFQGWSAIVALWKSFFERFSEVHLGVDKVQVRVSGDLAYATYDWALTGRMGDYALDDRGQATEIFQRSKAGWKVVHLHYSARPPEGPDETSAGAAAPQQDRAPKKLPQR